MAPINSDIYFWTETKLGFELKPYKVWCMQISSMHGGSSWSWSACLVMSAGLSSSHHRARWCCSRHLTCVSEVAGKPRNYFPWHYHAMACPCLYLHFDMSDTCVQSHVRVCAVKVGTYGSLSYSPRGNWGSTSLSSIFSRRTLVVERMMTITMMRLMRISRKTGSSGLLACSVLSIISKSCQLFRAT